LHGLKDAHDVQKNNYDFKKRKPLTQYLTQLLKKWLSM